jgi:hypothetical protein
MGLEVNADKSKYMVMSRDQNAGRNHSIKIDNSSFERVDELKYMATNLTNQNSIQEEVKSRLKSGNACYYSVQNLLCSRLLRLLVGKPEGKRTLGRPRRRWEDNVKMDLQEVGCGCEDWIGLV